MKENRLAVLCAVLAILCFAAFGYMCYRQGQGDFTDHPACTCDMVKNHECPP